jgi:hypothetical protein
MMLRRGSFKRAGMVLMLGFLMSFDAILHPKGARMENVRDETRRKKDAQSGEPLDGKKGSSSGGIE